MRTLNFRPGSDFSYSNTPYTLASVIVQKLSGMPLAEFCKEHIFTPLGMKDTTIIETHGEIVRNRAYGYQELDHEFQVMMPNFDLTGPTNLQTTVEDLMRWEQNFESKTVGGDAALSAMQTTVPHSLDYGLGLYIQNHHGMRVVEHDGRDAGYRSHFIRLPGEQLAIALLCNVALPNNRPTWDLVRDVVAVFLNKQVPIPRTVAAVPHRPAPSSKHAPLTDYVGRYYSEEIGSTYIIGKNGPSSLALARWKYAPTHLTAAGKDTFHISNFSVMLGTVQLTFHRDEHDEVDGFRMDDISGGDRLRDFRFTKVQ
jgi:CubicO group peptidase (beta-lactamase class C family)